MTCRSELIGGAPLSKERAAEHYHAEGKDQENNEINCVHADLFLR
jgi:hypothetical protein